MCVGRRSINIVKIALKVRDSYQYRNLGYKKGKNGQYYAPGTQGEAFLKPEKKKKGQAWSRPKRRISLSMPLGVFTYGIGRA